MKDETLNMSIRKYLKTVGVNSQIAIEKAVHKALAQKDFLERLTRDGSFVSANTPEEFAAWTVEAARLDAERAARKAALAEADGGEQVDDAGGEFLQKDTVMRNEDQRPAPAFKEIFEPVNGLDIEMVGRFVE